MAKSKSLGSEMRPGADLSGCIGLSNSIFTSWHRYCIPWLERAVLVGSTKRELLEPWWCRRDLRKSGPPSFCPSWGTSVPPNCFVVGLKAFTVRVCAHDCARALAFGEKLGCTKVSPAAMAGGWVSCGTLEAPAHAPSGASVSEDTFMGG